MSSNKQKQKQSKSQVIMKTDTTSNWKLCEDKYIPAPFTIIVYQDLDKPPRIKISDGVTLLKDLPFANNPIMDNDNTTAPSVDGAVLTWT